MIQSYYCAKCDISGNASSCPICGAKTARVENDLVINQILGAEFVPPAVTNLGPSEYLLVKNARCEFNYRYLDLLHRTKSMVSRGFLPKFEEKIATVVAETLEPQMFQTRLEQIHIEILNELLAENRTDLELIPISGGLEVEITRIQKLSVVQSVLNLLNMNARFAVAEFNYSVKEMRKDARNEKIKNMKQKTQNIVKKMRRSKVETR